jgi:hypothetical protein
MDVPTGTVSRDGAQLAAASPDTMVADFLRNKRLCS